MALTEESFAQEGALLGRVAELASKYPVGESTPAARTAADIRAALDEFMECVRYLNTRRSENSLRLESESAVQDALYLMLRPWVRDLVPETPTDRVASRFTIKDFRTVSARTIIEAKFVRDRDHGRTISREMHDDIETYRSDPACDYLLFFVYDPNVLIPDRAALERQIQIERSYEGRRLQCYVIVKP